MIYSDVYVSLSYLIFMASYLFTIMVCFIYYQKYALFTNKTDLQLINMVWYLIQLSQSGIGQQQSSNPKPKSAKSIKKMLKIQQLISKLPRSLTTIIRKGVHHDGTSKPLQYNLQYTAEQKKLLFKRRLINNAQLFSNDVLIMPGFQEHNIMQLVHEYQQRKVDLTPTNTCMLIFMLTKYNVMTSQCFDAIEKQAYRFTGQYQTRSIYGGLYGSIVYGRKELAKFFINQYRLSQKKFSMEEIASVMKALLSNRLFGKKYVSTIWNENFRETFLDGLFNLRIKKPTALTTIFDLMNDIGQTDPKVWKRLIQLMRNKKSWDRIPILERLNNLRSQYKQADKLFNVYFQQMAADPELITHYNLSQLRFYTPLQIIEAAQKNPSDYQPKIRTLIPQTQNADEWNEKYEQYLTVGAVKQQQQIIKDKSKSLGFAIRDRYENLEADGLDFSKMSKQQFQEMFGDYDQTMKTISKENQKIQELERKKEEEQKSLEAQKQEEDGDKKKKGKGKDKKNKQDAGQGKKSQKKQKQE